MGIVTRGLPALLALLVVAACGDRPVGPDLSAPVELRLVSPAGAEGAALVEIEGAGTAVAIDATEVVSEVIGGRTRVVLIRENPGELRFRFTPAEGERRGAATVIDVAGPDNAIRASIPGYRVEAVQ
ncbi:MAG: hypothetical protein HOP28_10545 [Gemmatimonadales bacterium]|nr:hypothetical protein [Gemmatimonadales bacterium]